MLTSVDSSVFKDEFLHEVQSITACHLFQVSQKRVFSELQVCGEIASIRVLLVVILLLLIMVLLCKLLGVCDFAVTVL